MNLEVPRPVLTGRKALVVGVANENSIAWGCAKAFHELGAQVAITYLNDKARPYVEPLARTAEAPLFLPLDVSVPGQLEAAFEASKPCSHALASQPPPCRTGMSTGSRPRARHSAR